MQTVYILKAKAKLVYIAQSYADYVGLSYDAIAYWNCDTQGIPDNVYHKINILTTIGLLIARLYSSRIDDVYYRPKVILN